MAKDLEKELTVFSLQPMDVGITCYDKTMVMYETNALRCVQSGGATGEIWTYDLVRCSDTGYYFIALSMLRPQRGYAVEEENGRETLATEDLDAAFQ
eukprot:4574615-Pleurochrysis_carterae.AAC.1